MSTNLIARFWSKVVKTNDSCWTYIGSLNTSGYGQAWMGQQILAHRLSWIIAFGKIPDGLYVLHKCDNRQCVNPDHLFLGTYKDNSVDMLSKDRGNKAFGETSGMTKLTDEVVREIVSKYESGKYSQRELGRQYGVSQAAVGYVVRGKSWKHVSKLPS